MVVVSPASRVAWVDELGDTHPAIASLVVVGLGLQEGVLASVEQVGALEC